MDKLISHPQVFVVMYSMDYEECTTVDSVHVSRTTADARMKELEARWEDEGDLEIWTAWITERPFFK